jgi:mannosylglycerate hydrolase
VTEVDPAPIRLDERREPPVHLVPHTHWDREWYLPFQTFRLRLVGLIDELLDRMANQPELVFTLDGQVATVDDYLELRPEREPDIRRAIGEGRLAVGPWRILMDESHVSGETIIRNLQMGWRRGAELGGGMAVGYLPDMFGHIAQMPQILRRARLEHAVVWRGVSAAIEGHRFAWASPDGSTVRAEYLHAGYGNASNLFVSGRPAEKLAAFRDRHRELFGGDPILAMYGSDHTIPDAGLVDVVRAVNEGGGDVTVRLSSLDGYLGEFADEAAAIAADDVADDVPRWVGELRAAARANLLPGVTSARIDTKIAIARAERVLERYAEPLAAIHGPALGLAWPEAELRLAWERVVDSSAHDSICGCSADAVVRQVLVRLAEAAQIAEGLAARVASSIAGGVPRGSFAIINPSPRPRAGVVELEVVAHEDWPGVELELPDGRRIPTQERRRKHEFLFRTEMPGDEVVTWIRRRLFGREVYQHQLNGWREDVIEGRPTITLEVDDEADPPWLDLDALLEGIDAAVASRADERWFVRVRARSRRTVVAVMPDVPALGWTSAKPVAAHEAPASNDAPLTAVLVDGRRLESDRLRVDVADEGTLTITGADTVLRGVGRLVDGGDAGDAYDYAPPVHDLLVGEPAAVETELLEAGPLVGRIAITRTYDWPRGLGADRTTRTPETARVEVRTEVELRLGEPFARIRLSFDNPSRDHRVRFHVPLDRPADRSVAEGQLGVVERGLAIEGGHGEHPTPTFPARGWVAAGSAAVLLDHVLEYELVDVQGTTATELALTILRSFGRISRNDNPWRDEPAGPETDVPEAQLLGPWSVGFAIMPISGAWHATGIIDAAEHYQHPLLTAGGRRALDASTERVPHGEGVRITGDGVALSALLRVDDELEVRLVAEHPTPTVARLEGRFDAAREVDLLARPIANLPAAEAGRLELPMEPWQIRTLRLRSPG